MFRIFCSITTVILSNIVIAGDLTPVVIDLPSNPTNYFEIWGKNKNTCMRSGLVTLLPGTNVGFHSTEDFEEFIIPLEGAGRMETKGGSSIRFQHGQMLHANPNSEHNVFNDSKKIVLRYIYIVANTKCKIKKAGLL